MKYSICAWRSTRRGMDYQQKMVKVFIVSSNIFGQHANEKMNQKTSHTFRKSYIFELLQEVTSYTLKMSVMLVLP
jgi:hypothetical protein